MPALRHARRSSSIALAVKAMIGIGRRADFLFGAADAARSLKSVEAGHFDVHQDDFEPRRLAARRRFAERRRLPAVVRARDFEAEPAQRLLGDRGVDFIVLGEQRAGRIAGP